MIGLLKKSPHKSRVIVWCNADLIDETDSGIQI